MKKREKTWKFDAPLKCPAFEQEQTELANLCCNLELQFFMLCIEKKFPSSSFGML